MRDYTLVRNQNLADTWLKANDDGDNGLDIGEFRKMLHQMNMDKYLSNKDMEDAFAYADPDNSGKIEYDEFCQIFMPEDPLAAKRERLKSLGSREKELRGDAAKLGTQEDRDKALRRVQDIKSLITDKLLQKKNATSSSRNKV